MQVNAHVYRRCFFWYSRFHVILQNSRFISQISFHFFVSFFKFSSHGRVDLAPECPSRQSKIIFRKISAIRLKMVCCMPLSSHKKVPYSKERQRLHAFCHGVPRGFFRACKALDWERINASSDSIVESNMKTWRKCFRTLRSSFWIAAASINQSSCTYLWAQFDLA